MAPPTGDCDGTRAGHGDDSFVLYALGVVELLAVDAALALRDECVDSLVAVYALVSFREPSAFTKPVKLKQMYLVLGYMFEHNFDV